MFPKFGIELGADFIFIKKFSWGFKRLYDTFYFMSEIFEIIEYIDTGNYSVNSGGNMFSDLFILDSNRL